MLKIKFNKYEIALSTLLILLIVVVSYILLDNLNGKVLITTPINKAIFFDSQSTDISINLNNQTLTRFTEKNNTYIGYKFIDKLNNVILKKDDAFLITLDSYEQKDFSISITPPSDSKEYLLKIYLYSDNKIPKYTNLTLKTLNISDSLLSENISINTPLTELDYKYKLTIPLEIVNTGNLPLYNDMNYYISYHIYDKDNNLLRWDGKRIQLDKSIYPDEKLTQEISITDLIFDNPGTYYLQLDIVHENFSWLSQYYLNCPIITINTI